MRTAMLGLAAWLAAAGGALAAGANYHVIDRIPGPDGGWDYVRVDPVHNRVLVTRGAARSNLDGWRATPAGRSGG